MIASLRFWPLLTTFIGHLSRNDEVFDDLIPHRRPRGL